jgi:hypothetical protein
MFKKRIEAGKAALPDNLKDKLHTDWPGPLSKVPRALTAFKWRQPPILLLGKNVIRWDTAEPKDVNVLTYPFGKGWLFRPQGEWRPVINNKEYGPNAIQKIQGTWTWGFHITWPLGIHFYAKLWKYKEPTPEELAKGYDGVRIVYFRVGGRWDSWDDYYNLGFFIGATFN